VITSSSLCCIIFICPFYTCILLIVPVVTIVNNPAGTPVSGSTNTFDYPISSSVILTCMVDPSPPAGTTYQWNTGGCFTNNAHNVPTCFPTGQTTQSVIGNNLLAEDTGTITCTTTIHGLEYTSRSLTLRISGIHVIYLNMQLLFVSIFYTQYIPLSLMYVFPGKQDACVMWLHCIRLSLYIIDLLCLHINRYCNV